jgi:hypothetical protein
VPSGRSFERPGMYPSDFEQYFHTYGKKRFTLHSSLFKGMNGFR